MVETSEGIGASAFVRRPERAATERTTAARDSEISAQGPANGPSITSDIGRSAALGREAARAVTEQVTLTPGAQRALEASTLTLAGARRFNDLTADLDRARGGPTDRIARFSVDLARIFGADDANATALAARIGEKAGEINSRFADLTRQAERIGFVFNELSFSVRIDTATVSFAERNRATTIRLEEVSLSLGVGQTLQPWVDPVRAAIAQDPFDLDPGSFRFAPPPAKTTAEVAEELRRIFGETRISVAEKAARAEIFFGETIFVSPAGSAAAQTAATQTDARPETSGSESSGRENRDDPAPLRASLRLDLTA
ncbi:MAG: hypothetical protein QNJ84_06865 [Alphaproteobacteria bacterium]|nr:hypothetical protein [Alphaproteobacteria bacterium]